MTVKTCLESALLVVIVPPACQGNDDDVSAQFSPNAAARFVAIDRLHSKIQQHDFRAVFEGHADTALAVVGDVGSATNRVNHHRHRVRSIFVVIDDDNAPLKMTLDGRCRCRHRRIACRAWQFDFEVAAAAGAGAPRTDSSAMHFDQAPG